MHHRTRSRGAVAGTLTAALVAAGVVALPTAAWAAPGDASATGVVVGIDATALGLINITPGVTAGFSSVSAGDPDADESTTLSLSAPLIGLAAADGAVITTSASTDDEASTASATVTDLDIDLLGIDLVTLGAATSSVTCPAVGTPTAQTTLAGLEVLGQAVTVVADTPPISLDLGLTAFGVADATLVVTLTEVETVSADGAIATALQLGLDLQTSLPSILPVLELSGTITIASATCEPPTVAAAPEITVSDVSPTEGPTSGGTTVTVTGTDLDTVTEVTFGGVPGTDVTPSEDGTTLTVVTPPSETGGPVPIVLVAPGGNVGPGDFTYVAPTVDDVAPSQGPEAGGTAVTITGSGLADAVDVTFDGVSATSVTVVDDGTVTAVTPPGTGVVDVVVVLPGADAVAPDAFAYVPDGAPVVTALSPDEGPTSGGTEVTITGENLAGTTSVTFDGAPAAIVSNPDDSTLVVTTPAGTAGPVDVVITNGDGLTSALPDGFTYLEDGSDAVVTDIDPDTVSTSGGTEVTIVGTDLDGAIGVEFDGTPGTDVVVSEDGTTITVTAPPSDSEGPATVTIVFPGGEAEAGEVTYVAPTIGSVTPDTGPTTGGTSVTITGEDLGAATQVTFGGTPGTDLVVADDGTSLTVTTPPGTAGTVDVVVVLPGVNAVAEDAFTYRTPPTASGIDPDRGPTTGGQLVLVTGSGFVAGATTVSFDGTPSPQVTVVSGSELLAITPPGDAGTVEVVVLVDGLASAPLAYTYQPVAAPPGDGTDEPPTITDVDPDSGSTSGGTTVVVIGTGFVPGQTYAVLCGRVISADRVSVNADGTTATFRTPACSAGTATLTVQTPFGSATADFRYVDPQGSALAVTGWDGLAPLVGLVTLLLLGGAAAVAWSHRRTAEGEPALGG